MKKTIEINQDDFKDVKFKNIIRVNYVDIDSQKIIIEVEEE